MIGQLRAALLAGALIATSGAAWAEPLTLPKALTQAGNSPRITQAKAQTEAAEACARQAGASPNPEFSLEVENFAGTGPFRNVRSAETTLALSQRLELGGKRGAMRRWRHSSPRHMKLGDWSWPSPTRRLLLSPRTLESAGRGSASWQGSPAWRQTL